MESITITVEQFNDAVIKANDKFKEIGDKRNTDSKNEMADLMMGLQNILFGGLIREVLFKAE